MSFIQNTIAIVYDFDGTLSPKPMQEYTVLPALGISSQAFWRQCEQEAISYKADKMLTYMRRLVEELGRHNKKIDKDELQAMGKKISYFTGVEQWFNLLNHYVKRQSNDTINIKHYIISAGLKELLNGISIKDEFANIFASEYFFSTYGKAQFPTVVVNDTNKTQYLFRINKGKEEINQSINQHMPKPDRPIPFSNILYIGDGDTDVPCMTLTKEYGGYAMAVYPPNTSKKSCKSLFQAGRIDYYAAADYSQNSPLMKKTKLILDSMISNIKLAKDKHLFKIKERLN